MDEPSSQHAQLEVAILGSEPAPSEAVVDDHDRDSSGGRAVLILSVDPDVRSYIRKCLHTFEEVSVCEGVIWRDVREEFIDALPQLFVIEASSFAMAAVLGDFREPCLRDVPRLLILDERIPGGAADIPGPHLILSKPFNADRLLTAASMLLD